MARLEFEKLVREALAKLPRRIRDAMDNVAFVVEKESHHKKAREIGIRINETLLGLYEGIPRIKRGSGYFGVLPDKITIFQKSSEHQQLACSLEGKYNLCSTRAPLRRDSRQHGRLFPCISSPQQPFFSFHTPRPAVLFLF